MRKVLLTLLITFLAFGLFAATGYAGYRFGYAQGVQATLGNDDTRSRMEPRPFDDFRPRGMHNFGFGRDFPRRFGPGSVPMMGFGFFSPLLWLGPIAVLALISGLVYWLFARGRWRLTRQPAENIASKAESE